MTLAATLTRLPGRCTGCGYHIVAQGCHCGGSEWATFVRALRQAADASGLISQTRMRPLIAAIPHKHRGQMYRRAVAEGLIEQAGLEPSTDARGRNTDKQQRLYRATRPASPTASG